jgi:hypothetical protein
LKKISQLRDEDAKIEAGWDSEAIKVREREGKGGGEKEDGGERAEREGEGEKEGDKMRGAIRCMVYFDPSSRVSCNMLMPSLSLCHLSAFPSSRFFFSLSFSLLDAFLVPSFSRVCVVCVVCVVRSVVCGCWRLS